MFKSKLAFKKPAWDVQTRWNSTYLMLELAVHLKPAINRLPSIDKRYTLCPSEQDWDYVIALVGHLKIFYIATNKLSGSKYPTLNIFFTEFCEVYLNIKKMEASAYPFIVQMGIEMMAKWDKYWKTGSTLLCIACILDLRCKISVVEYYVKMMYPVTWSTFIDEVKQCMTVLFNEYLEGEENQQATSSSIIRYNIYLLLFIYLFYYLLLLLTCYLFLMHVGMELVHPTKYLTQGLD
jgi:hypothetical protein